jgi:hypothetical protein
MRSGSILRSLSLALLLLAVGCGASASTEWARPQIVNLDWHENCGTRADRLPISTRRLIVGKRRWEVDLSFRNETSVTLGVIRPHFLGDTYFGLEPFETASLREVRKRAEKLQAKPRTIADRFRPSKPRLLSPGDSWSGSFSGIGRLPAHTPIRMVLGRFVITGDVPKGFYDGFLCISKRVVRLK